MKTDLYVVDLIVRQVVAATSAGEASILAAQNSQAHLEANGFIHTTPFLVRNISSLPPGFDGSTVPTNSLKTVTEILAGR